MVGDEDIRKADRRAMAGCDGRCYRRCATRVGCWCDISRQSQLDTDCSVLAIQSQTGSDHPTCIVVKPPSCA